MLPPGGRRGTRGDSFNKERSSGGEGAEREDWGANGELWSVKCEEEGGTPDSDLNPGRRADRPLRGVEVGEGTMASVFREPTPLGLSLPLPSPDFVEFRGIIQFRLIY